MRKRRCAAALRVTMAALFACEKAFAALTLIDRSGRFCGMARGRSYRLGVRARGHLGWIVVPILALIGAPAWSALRNECDLCPRTCPMHQHGEPAASAGHHLGCHAASAHDRHAHQNAAPYRGPAVTRASCGNHGILPATVLPTVLLPAPHGLPRLLARATSVRIDPRRPDRLLEPPDTPPPISSV
jgi:hypothetical protein